MQRQRTTRDLPVFEPLSVKEEVELLLNDTKTFQAARSYVRPLIEQVLIRQNLEKELQTNLIAMLDRDVPIAAQRFLSTRKEKRYRFSTYFTWYIKARLEQAGKLDQAA